MITIKAICAVGVIILLSSSSFAANNFVTEVSQVEAIKKKLETRDHEVKPPVLININPAAGHPVAKIKIEPLEKPLARDASAEKTYRFIYTYDKNTKSKIYRPSMSNEAENIPNFFED